MHHDGLVDASFLTKTKTSRHLLVQTLGKSPTGSLVIAACFRHDASKAVRRSEAQSNTNVSVSFNEVSRAVRLETANCQSCRGPSRALAGCYQISTLKLAIRPPKGLIGEAYFNTQNMCLEDCCVLSAAVREVH